MEDKKDFDSIFRQYYGRLCAYAGQFVFDNDSCADIVSEAFENLWSDFSHIKKTALQSYLYKNVHNKCIDYIRHQKVKKRYVDLYMLLTESTFTQEELEAQQEREKQMEEILAKLNSQTREIFLACYADGKKYKEVAEITGLSIASIQKYIVKALKIIREERMRRR
ncbi:RNA polymerase factor sigma-70 [Prevotella sp. oral taxon 376]|uniref:RNA polymerase sigma-70 factor n=1 Tax=Prevotella sp. oral taxon 376 TaxID=712466 RepID=UPI000D1FB1A9|nr:RNA polymerase sigma-70 factor [Prevotella sp. oral taxon 376]PTL33907.1 RNA polymerase factor sigma-70 [Prevotella sp. oral taxon 376]